VARIAAIFLALSLALGLLVFMRDDGRASPVLHAAFLVASLGFLGALVSLMTQKASESLRSRRGAMRDTITDDDHREPR
jgi:predicted lysophospholipase L1 biosynthesis ABC-type transport system permease subunit